MKRREEIDLYVVLTNGFLEGSGGRLPTNVGILRMNAAKKRLEENPQAMLALCGGIRDIPGNSEAAVYHNWFITQYLDLAARVILVSARAAFTAHDMVGLVTDLRALISEGTVIRNMYLVSYPRHAALAIRTLRACGAHELCSSILIEDSHEIPAYSPILYHLCYDYDMQTPTRGTKVSSLIIVAFLLVLILAVLTVLAFKRTNTTNSAAATSTPTATPTPTSTLGQAYFGANNTIAYTLPAGYVAYQCDALEARYIYNSDVTPMPQKSMSDCAYVLPSSVLSAETPNLTASTEVKSAQLDRVRLQALTVMRENLSTAAADSPITHDSVVANLAIAYQGVPKDSLEITESTMGSNHVFKGCVPAGFQAALTKGQTPCKMYLGSQNATLTFDSAMDTSPALNQLVGSIAF